MTSFNLTRTCNEDGVTSVRVSRLDEPVALITAEPEGPWLLWAPDADQDSDPEPAGEYESLDAALAALETFLPRETFAAFSERCRAQAARLRADLKRHYRGQHVQPREVELIAFNASGRVGEPLYASLRDLRGRKLERLVRDLLRDYPTATGVSVEQGFDLFDSFGDFLKGHDYEPRVEQWELDVPAHLVALARI